MGQWPKLERPPIVEALIDLRVEPRPDLQLDELAQLQTILGADAFPQAQRQLTGTIEFGESPTNVVGSSQIVGHLFRSADQTQVVQAQLTGFAFSRLRPYSSWEDLIANARTRWQQYVQVAKPQRVTRVGVRYINRIELPLPFGDFQEWIPEFPDIPAGLPQGLAEMFQRLVIPVSKDEEIMAIVTQAIEPQQLPMSVAVIFDIDIFRAGPWNADSDELWSSLERLRDLKNDFFFKYLSPRTLELFK